MWPDGICRVTNTRYTKTIQYQDINYQLSQNEDKTAIFEAWCDFLNYFDSSVQFQLSFVNLSASQETFARSISIPPCGDEFDGIRAEYAGMLQNQLARGNNGLIKTKYLTFGVEADNLRAAKPRLERIETDLLNNFKRLGVVAAPLNGFERLHVMHDILRMDDQEPFRFSWDWLPPSGLSTKDFIAPSSFEFKTGRMFRMGKKLGAISFVQILAPELNDRMLADFLDMESSVLVNLHVQSVDQVNAIKTVKRKITDLDKSKIEEQKKAVRAGYDMDIIPSDLATYGAEAKKLLQDLQSRNERMFLLTFLILNTADTPRQLDNNIFQTSSIAQKYNCALTRLDFQQEEGLMSSLPLGLNQIEMYVEKLRDKYDVTIAEAPDFRGERHIYTLRSIDHEAEAAINAYEAEFGADGTRVFRDPAADAPQPTVRELFDGYKLTVGNALSKDTAFVNACRNSDRQNAYLEGADAIRRIVTASDDLQLVRLYFDMPTFHNRLHQELLEELYPTLAATVAPSPYQITQEDIDNALLDWHNNLKGKQEVALYMQAHGRERSTAAWLAAKYGWEDSKTPMYIHVGNAEPVTLTWAQVQRRLAQLIRENKFYDENERLRLFSPDRYSIRLHPGEGGITGIWDEVLERFCGDGEQTLRFAEQNNAIAYLDGIKRDMGIELSPPAFTTPLGYTYHIGDRISSIELDHIAAVGVIARVDEDHVWHTLPNVPGQEPVSIDRNSFERYLDTRYFEVSEPEPQRVIAAQHTEQPTPETPQAVQNLMGQRVEIDGKLYNVDSADETVAHLSVVSSSSESNHDPEHRTEPVSAVLTRIADQGRELAPNISAYQALRAEHPEKLIGVRVGERLLFYGADAKRAASALNRRLLQRDIPGMGETAVTGYDFGQWASSAKAAAGAWTQLRVCAAK